MEHMQLTVKCSYNKECAKVKLGESTHEIFQNRYV